MYDYAIRFEEDNEPGVAVFCRDLPQLNSYGDNRDHAINEALDAIETTLSIYVDERRAIPAASAPLAGEHVVHLPAVTVAKIALWNAMMERDMRKADLCRLLGVHQAQGDRLVDFLHTSKMEQVEAALKAIGAGIRVSVKSSKTWIELPYGGGPEAGFYAERLVDVFKERNIVEMLTGAHAGSLDKVKTESLDYLLRTRYAKRPDTMQAVNEVFQQLVATGLFEHIAKGEQGKKAGVIRLV
jgi:predicted RNase H-like HicB family nuclease